jgi:large subunit ribosomal protein L3
MTNILVCEKLGMVQRTANGRRTPITVLRSIDGVVAELISKKRGENCVKVVYESCEERKLNKPALGYLKKHKMKNFRRMKELPNVAEALQIGDKLAVDESMVGMTVALSSKSKGHGFTGVMKRYNFSGLGASHGVSGKHRSGGSVGNCAKPAKIFKGKKMPGRHGNKQITINSRIEAVDAKEKLLLVSGVVAGARRSRVFLKLVQ